MKLIGRRAWVLMAICILFLVGMIFFIVTYIMEAPTWASSTMNKHIYRNGQLVSAGEIIDINEERLAFSKDGERKYNENKEKRKALMHLIGDDDGNVSTALQIKYRTKLVGWDFFNGIYSFGNKGGNTIKTTVNADVAKVAYSALNGRKGTVGVMNYKTGDIICMVSSTSFDPSNPPDISKDPKKYDGVFINRLLSATYTPGSIFKLVTVSAALNEIPGIEGRTFDCKGSITIEGGKINCTHKHGKQSFKETLVNSCNVAYAVMAEEIGAKKMTQYAEDAGLNTDLKMGNIKVATGVFTLKNADDLALAWSGIGQYETLINPLSYLQYVASIANDGKAVSPNIIDSITTEKGIPASIDIDIPKGKSLDEGTARTLQAMMRACVTENYGEGKLKGYNMAAKTGTAEVGKDKEPHSWFCGFLDRGDVPYAFIVLVENGGAGRSAAYDVASKVLVEAVK